jgi:LacI family transcriptional regulator, galactose operon repressor
MPCSPAPTGAVPSAVSVVGFDDIALAGFSRVSLTTVARPREEWARRAVALLLARIEGEIADERVR